MYIVIFIIILIIYLLLNEEKSLRNKIIGGGQINKKKRTFFILYRSQTENEIIVPFLESKKWKNVELNEITKYDYVDLIWFRTIKKFNFPHDEWKLLPHARLISYFNDTKKLDCILNKEMIIDSFNKEGGQHFVLQSYIIAHNNEGIFIKDMNNIKKILPYLHKSIPLILRPIGETQQQGINISIITSESDLSIINKYNNVRMKPDKIMASLYIEDLDFCDGRKYHIRLYLAVFKLPQSKIVDCKILQSGQIFISKYVYKKKDYNDTSIHIIHNNLETTLMFPEEFIWMSDVHKKKFYTQLKEMEECFRRIVSKIDYEDFRNKEVDNDGKPKFKDSFQIFGIDILVKSNFDLILLECNKKTSCFLRDRYEYDTKEKWHRKFVGGTNYMKEVYELIISKYFD